MRSGDLLAELGQFIRLPLAFDARGLCILVCGDGLEVEIADLGGAGILLTAEVARPPADGPAALHAAALRHAHDLQRSRGAALAIDPEAGGRLEIQALRQTDELDPRLFRRFVGDFILAARAARAALGASGATPSDGAEAPPAAESADMFFLRL